MQRLKFVGFFSVLLALTSQVWAQADLTILDVNAAAGSRVFVPVVISDGQGITALQFDVTFDTQTLSIPEGSSVIGGDAIADHSLGSNVNEGTLTVVIFSSSLASLTPGRGTVLQIPFEVAEDAADGNRNLLRISEVQAADAEGNSINLRPSGGGITVSEEGSLPGEGENELVFAQVANGTFAGGIFSVTLIFVNRTDVSAMAEIRFFKSDGTPFVVTLTNGQSDSTFVFGVPAGGSVFLQTDGTGEVSAGYARLTSTSPLGGTLLFALEDGVGNVIAEAGVSASPISGLFSIPVLFVAGASNTGIAFANILDQAVDMTLILKDEDGAELARVERNLPAGEHLPKFASEFFDILAGMAEFSGSIEVQVSVGVAAIALKQQGVLLTTFPVVVLQ